MSGARNDPCSHRVLSIYSKQFRLGLVLDRCRPFYRYGWGGFPYAWTKDWGLRSINTTLDSRPKVGSAVCCSCMDGTRRAEANSVRQSTIEPQTQERSKIVMQQEQHSLCLAFWWIVIGLETSRCVKIGHHSPKNKTLLQPLPAGADDGCTGRAYFAVPPRSRSNRNERTANRSGSRSGVTA